MQNVTEENTSAIGGESDESESSTYRIEKKNRITDRNKYQTAQVKVNGIEKEFTVGTGSLTSIIPADEDYKRRSKFKNRTSVSTCR